MPVIFWLCLWMAMAPQALAQQQTIITGQVKHEIQQGEQLPGFNPKSARKPVVKPTAPRLQNKLLDSVDFYERTDAKLRYIEQRESYQNRHRGEIPVDEAAQLADQGFDQSTIEKPFSRWLFHGGDNPVVFFARAHLYNTMQKPALNTKLLVVVKGKIGPLLVNPDIQMTDFDHLYNNAHWETVWQETKTVPVVSPGEDMLFTVLGRFNMLRFEEHRPSQWPLQLQITVSAPGLGESVSKTLELVPDHFVVPELY